ncbi:FKBP-type peptidyl-prolyl cis-trans isomerase [Flavobacterium aquicola]|uniref:Peptidyl-prolyl cis-trans isomerase n=1 Tax=Flavobacterium aquicola TaxID=1682742 RepID=A0A3E0EPS1_9FLAO|nr:FKBP-type peptidyl-prolyl cis-trans isomerase [Flavobacterium aquicola]REG99743.1 FKBP-type peptidyl-prolyl isomerase-like protein [Flavobacterium aquicola]
MKSIIPIFLFLILISCSKSVITTKSGLQYRILEKGSGIKAKSGDEVFIYETTSYRNGTVLYSNYNSTSSVKVLIGGNQATVAIDEGLRGMRMGEVRELVAPPYLVKRKSYPPNVSPDSTLVIKIKLDKIKRK